MEKAVWYKPKKVHRPNPSWAQLWADKAVVSPGDGFRREAASGQQAQAVHLLRAEYTPTSPHQMEVAKMVPKRVLCSWFS